MRARSLSVVSLLAACSFLTEVTPPSADVGQGGRQTDAGASSVAPRGADGADAGSKPAGNEPIGTDPSGTDPSGTDLLGDGGSGGSVSDAGGVIGGCTGCVQLSAPSRRTSDYQLGFATARNLEGTALRWRVRVRDYPSDVLLVPYADSGDGFGEEATAGMLTLTEAQGWQDIVLDLAQVPAFRAPGVSDAGSAYDPGLPFDKTRVVRIGLALQPSGSAARALVELDALSFSDLPELDLDFAANAGGLVLVDSPGASATHIPE